MKKSLTYFLAISSLVLFTASSFAQPVRGVKRGQRMGRHSPSGILFVLKAHQEELKITDNQLEKIQSLVFSFQEKAIDARSANSKQRLELRKLMQDREKLDYEKIKAILSKTSSSRHEMFIEGLKLREEIGKILTPEQREALKDMRKTMRRGRPFFQRGDRARRFQRFKDRKEQ